MESEIEHIESKLFGKIKFKHQLEQIERASDEAKKQIDYDSAHNDIIIRAIEIIENFLRKKHRLCYGGQAINAHLPKKYKFYDPNYSIPDYDFFTPDHISDINNILKDLSKAGFTDVYYREGIHKDTIKIYVEFIPVADITTMNVKLYRILSKREFKVDGISYLDANTLRMLMYLELSRPRGEVSRWSKVFERLSLFNEFVSFKPCKVYDTFDAGLTKDQLEFVINYIIKNKRIFAGADLLSFYNKTLHFKKLNTRWVFTPKKPIMFFSSDIDSDSQIISSEFKYISNKNFSIKSYSSDIEQIPNMKIVCNGKKPLVFVVEQSACHSYFNIPIKATNIKIASIDTLITLYFSLGYINSAYFNIGSMECIANKLIEISSKMRDSKEKTPLPFISIKCIGYQPTFPSLIREKEKRKKEKRITHKIHKVQNIDKVLVKKVLTRKR